LLVLFIGELVSSSVCVHWLRQLVFSSMFNLELIACHVSSSGRPESAEARKRKEISVSGRAKKKTRNIEQIKEVLLIFFVGKK